MVMADVHWTLIMYLIHYGFESTSTQYNAHTYHLHFTFVRTEAKTSRAAIIQKEVSIEILYEV